MAWKMFLKCCYLKDQLLYWIHDLEMENNKYSDFLDSILA